MRGLKPEIQLGMIGAGASPECLSLSPLSLSLSLSLCQPPQVSMPREMFNPQELL